MTKQAFAFAGIMGLGMIIGGHLAAHIFFGIITLVGLIALAENIPFIKWFIYATNNVIDVLIFILAALATVKLGVTITAALTVAGIGYTMVYAPYIRKQQAAKKQASREQLRKDINSK